jgi:hypothetical protein
MGDTTKSLHVRILVERETDGASALKHRQVVHVESLSIREAVIRYGRDWVVKELSNLTERVRIGGSA